MKPPVAWVGGAMDSRTRLLRRHVRSGQQYFQWTQAAALRRWLQQHQSAVVIAHSYGASTAAAVVAAGYPVAHLITIDPVGWRKPDGAALRQHCQHWANYCAGDQRRNFANLVARAGGHWQHWPQHYANEHIEVAADHATIVAAVVVLPMLLAVN